MFADVGITLVINKVSSLQIGAIIMSTGWDGFMFSFAFPGKTIDPGFTASIYMNHGGVWISTLQPDDVQALCDAAAYEPDQTARIALYQQISKMMADEYCLHQYIYYQGSFSSITPFLKGYTIGEYTEFYAFTYSYLDYD
jgi:ABC-type transport system substrate-binding protein